MGVYEMEIHLHVLLRLVLDVVSFTTLCPYYHGWGLGGVVEMVWTQFRFSVPFIFYLSYLLVVLLTNYPAF